MNLITKEENDAISGFYYDCQLENESLVMTLHPNMWFDENSKDPSSFWNAFTENCYESDYTGTKKSSENEYLYSTTPIATAIVGEDFQVGVANQWEDQSMANELTNFWNSMKPLTPFLSKVGDSGINNTGKEALQSGDINAESSLGQGFQNTANKIEGVLEKAAKIGSNYLNRALVINGSRFSYYNGTGVAFGNLSMKFTLFSDWDPETGKWVSCIEKVQKLTPYVIGKYINGLHEITDNEIVNSFVGWQLPPGGFSPDLKTLDAIHKGTLMVVFAGLYAIPNLVIAEGQFNFSKQRMKYPISGEKIGTCPMYCDVQLTLKPASQYTGESFNMAIGGKSNVINTISETFDTKINDRLTDLNKSIVGIVNKVG